MAPVLNALNIDVMLSGHNHRDAYCEPNEVCHYPVLINSNKGIISAETQGDELKIKVIHDDGKEVTQKIFKARR